MAAEIDRQVRRVRERYPDLPVRRVRRVETGQYNDVLVINDELVLRFPRFAEGVRTLQREVAILQGIRPFITLPIPVPLYQSLESGAASETFVGYRLIEGSPLWRETLSSIDDEAALDRLATQLTTFLRELHQVPYRDAIAYDLPTPDHRAGWAALYARIREHLYLHMPRTAQERVSAHFESYLGNENNFTFPLALVHGDFGTANILFDEQRGEIVGVIDFGSAGLDDPALDFAALSTYGESFLQRLIACDPTIAAMRNRIDFYRGTFALQEALYGAEHGDQAAFERGITGYRS